MLQALAGRGYAGCLESVILGYRGASMQDLGYELPRILIPRTSVNKGKKKGRSYDARPFKRYPLIERCLQPMHALPQAAQLSGADVAS